MIENKDVAALALNELMDFQFVVFGAAGAVCPRDSRIVLDE